MLNFQGVFQSLIGNKPTPTQRHEVTYRPSIDLFHHYQWAKRILVGCFIFFNVHPCLGKIPILANMFQLG